MWDGKSQYAIKLTIGGNLSDIILTYGIVKNFFILSLLLFKLNIVDMKFNSISDV